jgi:acetolactate synthase-1/2/3 large subunit
MTAQTKIKGSYAIIRALQDEGCEVLFGYPGGVVIPFYDALYDSDLRHILVRHEQGAAHAAEGYARATGKVGVCVATSGPGATNLVTGIADAYLDSIPIVAITGQVKSDLIGTDAFQEADTTGITLPIVKHSYLVQHGSELPQIIHEAFHIASTGRPGPVLIDIPVTCALAEFAYKKAGPVDLPGYKPTTRGHIKQVRAVAKALTEASRPVLYIGGGVISSGATDEVLELAGKLQIPVTTTLMAMGAFPETHRLSLGMLGMHGTAYANWAVHECDLLVAVGARFDDRVTGKLSAFAPQAKVIHIDIDPAEIGKNVEPRIPVVGDAKLVLRDIVTELDAHEIKKGVTTDWLKKVDAWRASHPLEYEPGDGDGDIAPQYVVEQIYDVTGGDAIISTDVGQHQMWACQYFKYTQPRQFISSGGLGTMGFGVPAAIGAQIGRPDKQVINIGGDGSFQMTLQELGTAMAYQVPVVYAILNNRYLGMVRQWQELFWNKRYSDTFFDHQPDFAKIAEAYGAFGATVTSSDQVADVLRAAIADERPAVIDFRVRQEESVYPMVPAGSSITEMIGGSAGRRKKS